MSETLDADALRKAVREAAEKRRAATFPSLAEGFTLQANGRCGYIYFRRGEHMLEIYWEVSAAEQFDILLLPLQVTHWHRPAGVLIPESESHDIIQALGRWLASQRIRSDAFPTAWRR